MKVLSKLIWILFFSFSLLCYGQSKSIDSLKSVLEKTDSQNVQIDLNLQIAQKLVTIHNKDGFLYAQKAYDLAEANNLLIRKYKALLYLARLEADFGDKEKSKMMFTEVIAIAEKEKHNDLLFDSYIGFAAFNTHKNNPDLSIAFYLKGIEVAETLSQNYLALKGLTTLYIAQRSYEKACEYASKAYEVAIELEDLRKQVTTLSELGRCTMLQRKNYETAVNYLEKTIALSDQIGEKKISGYANIDLGQINFIVKKDTLQGIKHFEKGLQLAEEIGDSRLRITSEMVLGNIYLKSGKETEGFNLMKSSYMKSLRKNEFNYAIQPARRLAEYYETRNADSALVWHKRTTAMSDTLNAIKKLKEFKEIETKYEVAKKEDQINELENEKSLLSKRLKKLWPIILLLIAISAMLFYFFKKNQKKATHLAAEQEVILEKMDHLSKIVDKDHIVLKDKTKVYTDDLMFVKADDHYLHVFIQDGKDHLVRGKLGQIEQELPPNFKRCHRSYIVNENFIKKINSSSLVLKNKMILPLSRSYKIKFG